MRRSTLVFFLLVACMTFMIGGWQAPGQDKAAAVNHYRTPETIPNFFAWRQFFWLADYSYRLGDGYFRGVVYGKLRLDERIDDKGLRLKAGRALADIAMRASRDSEKCGAEISSSAQSLKEGLIPNGVHVDREAAWLREEVKAIRRSRDSLKKALLSLDPVSGTDAWEAVRAYVEDGELKSEISIARENTPQDRANWRIYLSFDEEGDPR